jgi:hypothetical protein
LVMVVAMGMSGELC